MSLKCVLTYLVPLTLLSAMLLAACDSTSTPPSGGNTTPETVTIWHSWQGDALTARKAIFDAYMKAHPNITIKLIKQNKVVDNSVTAVKANNGPDIIAWVDDALGKLASSKTVISTDQYGINQNFVNSTYNKAAAAAVTFQGKTWGMAETRACSHR